jgi:hypothetical protein
MIQASRMAVCALALFATGAFAGQITMYEDPDFGGRFLIATGDMGTLGRRGFGDDASSIVVSSGVWEVCTDTFYRGTCAQLYPGNYPRLEDAMRGRVVSAREVAAAPTVVVVQPQVVATGTPVVVSAPAVTTAPVVVTPTSPVATTAQPIVVTAAPVPTVVGPATGRIVLYEYPNFGGKGAAIDRGQAKDLDWAGFRNPLHRATSLKVESGTWVVCTQREFQGDCSVLSPGAYPNLSDPLTTGIASAHQVWRPEYGALTLYTR